MSEVSNGEWVALQQVHLGRCLSHFERAHHLVEVCDLIILSSFTYFVTHIKVIELTYLDNHAAWPASLSG